MSDEEIPFFNNVDEYVAWADARPNPNGFNPHICSRHWWPIVEAHQAGIEAPGTLTLIIILAGEAFAFVPEGVGPNPDSINSWFMNQTVSTCCKLGDEKMAWLLDFVIHMHERCCMVKPWAWLPKGKHSCFYYKGHEGPHEFEKPAASIFAIMEEFG